METDAEYIAPAIAIGVALLAIGLLYHPRPPVSTATLDVEPPATINRPVGHPPTSAAAQTQPAVSGSSFGQTSTTRSVPQVTQQSASGGTVDALVESDPGKSDGHANNRQDIKR